DSGSVSLAAGLELNIAAIEQDEGISPVLLAALTGDAAAPVLYINDTRARVRVIHASPDAPNVDVLVDDAVALTDVPFPAASDYLPLSSGERNFKVNVAGTATTAIDVDVTLGGSTDYSVLAVGFVADIEPLLTVDELRPAQDGSAKL